MTLENQELDADVELCDSTSFANLEIAESGEWVLF